MPSATSSVAPQNTGAGSFTLRGASGSRKGTARPPAEGRTPSLISGAGSFTIRGASGSRKGTARPPAEGRTLSLISDSWPPLELTLLLSFLSSKLSSLSLSEQLPRYSVLTRGLWCLERTFASSSSAVKYFIRSSYCRRSLSAESVSPFIQEFERSFSFRISIFSSASLSSCSLLRASSALYLSSSSSIRIVSIFFSSSSILKLCS